jgi:hypothetical protein
MEHGASLSPNHSDSNEIEAHFRCLRDDQTMISTLETITTEDDKEIAG